MNAEVHGLRLTKDIWLGVPGQKENGALNLSQLLEKENLTKPQHKALKGLLQGVGESPLMFNTATLKRRFGLELNDVEIQLELQNPNSPIKRMLDDYISSLIEHQVMQMVMIEKLIALGRLKSAWERYIARYPDDDGVMHPAMVELIDQRASELKQAPEALTGLMTALAADRAADMEFWSKYIRPEDAEEYKALNEKKFAMRRGIYDKLNAAYADPKLTKDRKAVLDYCLDQQVAHQRLSNKATPKMAELHEMVIEDVIENAGAKGNEAMEAEIGIQAARKEVLNEEIITEDGVMMIDAAMDDATAKEIMREQKRGVEERKWRFTESSEFQALETQAPSQEYAEKAGFQLSAELEKILTAEEEGKLTAADLAALQDIGPDIFGAMNVLSEMSRQAVPESKALEQQQRLAECLANAVLAGRQTNFDAVENHHAPALINLLEKMYRQGLEKNIFKPVTPEKAATLESQVETSAADVAVDVENATPALIDADADGAANDDGVVLSEEEIANEVDKLKKLSAEIDDLMMLEEPSEDEEEILESLKAASDALIKQLQEEPNQMGLISNIEENRIKLSALDQSEIRDTILEHLDDLNIINTSSPDPDDTPRFSM